MAVAETLGQACEVGRGELREGRAERVAAYFKHAVVADADPFIQRAGVGSANVQFGMCAVCRRALCIYRAEVEVFAGAAAASPRRNARNCLTPSTA